MLNTGLHDLMPELGHVIYGVDHRHSVSHTAARYHDQPLWVHGMSSPIASFSQQLRQCFKMVLILCIKAVDYCAIDVDNRDHLFVVNRQPALPTSR